jgi:hypothetical protein
MSDYQRVQIIHLGTCITTLRRAVPRDELARTIENAFLYGGMSGVPYRMRADLKSQIVAAVMKHLVDTNHIEVYRELSDTSRPMANITRTW